MADIKISELSIGDWVKVNDLDKVLIQRVVAIDATRREIGIIKNNRGGIYWYYEDEIEPIPLTPEILEKNGWLPPRKAIELDTWWWTNGVDKAIEAYEYEGEWYLTIIEQKEIQYRNRVGIGLKHTHQLQHALRLAGVEKEIEL